MGYTHSGYGDRPSHLPSQLGSKNRVALHVILFVATFLTTVMAGTAWAMRDPFEVFNWTYGITYAILVMCIITAHEFGHYFAARHHNVDATLPYFIPFPSILLGGIGAFGTMGAVIRTRTPIYNRKALFDIGVAGPLAGVVMCIIILAIGFMTLPPKSFIYTIHPEYLEAGGAIPATGLHFGDTLLYWGLAQLFASPSGWLPPMNEMYHYPWLCAGWFGLILTGLNLLPIGQLDGGHISYAMFGDRQPQIARYFWWFITILGCGGVLGIVRQFGRIELLQEGPLAEPGMFLQTLEVLHSVAPWLMEAWAGWLLWAFVTRVFIKIKHPPIDDPTPLDSGRRRIGWTAIAIFVLTFTYNGVYDRFGIPEEVPSSSRDDGGLVVEIQP